MGVQTSGFLKIRFFMSTFVRSNQNISPHSLFAPDTPIIHLNIIPVHLLHIRMMLRWQPQLVASVVRCSWWRTAQPRRRQRHSSRMPYGSSISPSPLLLPLFALPSVTVTTGTRSISDWTVVNSSCPYAGSASLNFSRTPSSHRYNSTDASTSVTAVELSSSSV